MSKQADIRVRLDEIKSRLNKLDEVNSADIGLQMSVHYAVDTMLQKDLPAMAAALTAVLDLHAIEDGKGIFYGDCRACAYTHPCPTVTRIADALGGDRG